MDKKQLEEENQDLLIRNSVLEEHLEEVEEDMTDLEDLWETLTVEKQELKREVATLEEEKKALIEKALKLASDVKGQVIKINKELKRIDLAYELKTPKTFEELMDTPMGSIYSKEAPVKKMFKGKTLIHQHPYLSIKYKSSLYYDRKITFDNFEEYQDIIQIKILLEAGELEI